MSCLPIHGIYAYSAYGETAVLGPDGGNALRYTGREDDGNGLFYYRARYYDPVLKRFVSEDPIALEAGPNFYAYVGGNPISRSDPSGLWVPQAVGATVGAVSGAIQTGNSVGWSWSNAGTIASGTVVGAASGAVGTFSIGRGVTAVASSMWAGGTAGFFGNISSQVVVNPSLAVNPSCIDYRQAAFQGFVGLGSGYLGGSAYGPFAVRNPAVASAAVSGTAQSIFNLGVSPGLGGFGAVNIVR